MTRKVHLQCGAKTREGTPCQCKCLPGKRRCKFHGGMSTGPRTVEGKERSANNLKKAQKALAAKSPEWRSAVARKAARTKRIRREAERKRQQLNAWLEQYFGRPM